MMKKPLAVLQLLALQSHARYSLSYSLATTTVRTTSTTSTATRHQRGFLAATMASSSADSSASSNTRKSLVVDPFCFRQFAEHQAGKTYGGEVLYVPKSKSTVLMLELEYSSLLLFTLVFFVAVPCPCRTLKPL